MSEGKQHGIKEITEVIDFCDQFLDKLKEHKADDGKVDAGEALQAIGD